MLLWTALAAGANPLMDDGWTGSLPPQDPVVEVPSPWVPPTQAGPVGIWNGSNVNGTHLNVVALAMVDPWYGFPSVFCSGSLIQANWVLTASHCLEGLDSYADYGVEFFVMTGDDLTRGRFDQAAEMRRWILHPSYDGSRLLNDIGLVELQSVITDTTYMVLNDASLNNSWLGENLNFVGYGVTSDGASDGGRKRETEIEIVDYDGMYVYSYDGASNVCQGDSGGSAIYWGEDGPVQVGVNVFVTPGCVGGSNGASRVDAYLDWIQDYVPDVYVASGEPPPDGGTPGGGTGGTGGGGGGGGGGGSGAAPLGEAEVARPEGEPESFGAAWEDPQVPAKGTYPAGLGCRASAPLPLVAGGWLVLLGLALRRRR